VGVGQLGEHLQLLGHDRPVGDLHPHHLVVAALALAVDAVVQPEDPEGVLVDRALEVTGQHRLELLDVSQLVGIDLGGEHRRGLSGVDHTPRGGGVPRKE
jgi:hypothetical protein